MFIEGISLCLRMQRSSQKIIVDAIKNSKSFITFVILPILKMAYIDESYLVLIRAIITLNVNIMPRTLNIVMFVIFVMLKYVYQLKLAKMH